MTISTRSSILLGSAAMLVGLALASPAAAWDVMGCTYRGGSPNGFIDCVNNASNDRVNQARGEVEAIVRQKQADLDAAKETVARLNDELSAARARLAQAERDAAGAASTAADAVRHSANFAATSAELSVLNAARKLPYTRFFQCLEQSGAVARFEKDVEQLSADPGAGARDLVLAAWRARPAAADLSAQNMIDAARSPDPGKELQRLLAAGRQIASSDPVGRCASQVFDPAVVLSAAEELRSTIDQERQRAFEQQIRPVLEKAIAQAQNLFLTRFREELESRLHADTSLAPRRIAIETTRTASYGGGEGLEPFFAMMAPPPGGFDPGPVGSLLKDVLSVDVSGIANEAFVRGMLIPRLSASSTEIQSILTRLNSSPPFAPATPAERARLKTLVHAALGADSKVRAEVEIEVLMGIVKSMGNNYIGSSEYLFSIPGGGKLVDLGYLGIDQIVEEIFRLITSGAGAAPAAGSVVSMVENVYKGLDKSIAADIARALAKKAMLIVAQGVYSNRMDAITADIKSHSSGDLNATLDDLRRSTPGFAPVFDFIQSRVLRTLASSYLTQLEMGLDDQEGRVEELILKAVP